MDTHHPSLSVMMNEVSIRASGHVVGRKRVARLMRQAGLRARARRRYAVTTQSKHKHPIAPNVVARKSR